MEVPAPQLIPAPAAAGGTFNQGPSAHPVQEALAVVADANAHATRSPTPEGFLNAIQYYDYAPGVRYNTVAAAGYITTIRLRPGERLQQLFCSDTASYNIDQAQEGVGPTAATVILFKPKHAGVQSNWVLTTDERTYFLDVFVNAEPNYQSAVAWYYPLDGMRVLGDRREQGRLRVEKNDAGGLNAVAPAHASINAMPSPAAPATNAPNASATEGVGPAVGPLGMNLDHLNFDYVVLYQSRGRDGKTKDAAPPPWAPLRVFDDGSKTFVQFPPAARNYELPPVFALDHPDAEKSELVNYRRSGDFLVLDQLVVAAEMRAGDAPQQVVKIARGKAADPGTPAAAKVKAQPDPQVVPEASAANAASTNRPLAGYLYDHEEN